MLNPMLAHSSVSSKGSFAGAPRFGALTLMVMMGALACGQIVEPSGSVSATLPDASTSDVSRDVLPPSCAGDGANRALGNQEGNVRELVTDECSVYWIRGYELRAARKSGGESLTLAKFPNWEAPIAQDDSYLYAGVSEANGAWKVLRVRKTDGSAEVALEDAPPGVQAILVRGTKIFMLGEQSLALFDTQSRTQRSIPVRGGGRTLLSFEGAVLAAHAAGVTAYAEDLSSGKEVLSLGSVSVNDIAASDGHLYVASSKGLLDVEGLQGSEKILLEGAVYFSVAAFGDRVVFGRGGSLEYGIYERGAERTLEKTGMLGNRFGLAADASGIYWARDERVERHRY